MTSPSRRIVVSDGHPYPHEWIPIHTDSLYLSNNKIKRAKRHINRRRKYDLPIDGIVIFMSNRPVCIFDDGITRMFGNYNIDIVVASPDIWHSDSYVIV